MKEKETLRRFEVDKRSHHWDMPDVSPTGEEYDIDVMGTRKFCANIISDLFVVIKEDNLPPTEDIGLGTLRADCKREALQYKLSKIAYAKSPACAKILEMFDLPFHSHRQFVQAVEDTQWTGIRPALPKYMQTYYDVEQANNKFNEE